jgi:hypothetical protein
MANRKEKRRALNMLENLDIDKIKIPKELIKAHTPL